MKPQITYEDKIAPTFSEENWSINNQYEKLTIVTDIVTGDSYISKRDVPEGVELTNTAYWLPFGRGKSGDFNKLKLRGYLIQAPNRDYIRCVGNVYQYLSSEPRLTIEDFLYKLNDNYTLTNISTNSTFTVKWSSGSDYYFVSIYYVTGKGFVFIYESPNAPHIARSIVQAIRSTTSLEIGVLYPINTSRNDLLNMDRDDFNPYFKLVPVFEPEIRELTL